MEMSLICTIRCVLFGMTMSTAALLEDYSIGLILRGEKRSYKTEGFFSLGARACAIGFYIMSAFGLMPQFSEMSFPDDSKRKISDVRLALAHSTSLTVTILMDRDNFYLHLTSIKVDIIKKIPALNTKTGMTKLYFWHLKKR